MRIDDFKIKTSLDLNAISNELKAGKTMQEILGFSDETLVRYYEAARNILDEGRFSDAIDSFYFLTVLNPYLAYLWQGLALSYQSNHEYKQALSAYTVVTHLEGKKIFPYMMAVQCCIEMKEFDRAQEILARALQYAKRPPISRNGRPSLKKTRKPQRNMYL